MIVPPGLQWRERGLIQQTEDADAGSRPDVNAAAGNGGRDELIARAKVITRARLIGIEQLDSQVCGCVGVQSRRRCISRRPQNAINVAIGGNAGRRSGINEAA